MANNAVALLLIGGLGVRYGTVPPKQFQVYEGKPLFLHAASILSSCLEKIVYVCHEDYFDLAKSQLKEASLLRENDVFVKAGPTRQASVLAGLTYLKDNGFDDEEIVVINDGNRPHISKEMVYSSIAKAKINGSAVTAYRSVDSILMSKDGLKASSYASRSEVFIVQTPQAFKFGLLYNASKNTKEEYSDDGSLLLKETGLEPLLVEGSITNIKVTVK